jgi:raffinose/stachyose/melibiose transport system substrate-binding protein
MRRRRFAFGAIGLSVAALLVTAVSASARPSAPQAPGTPRVSGTLTITVGLTIKASYEQMLKNFAKAYPDVTVRPTYLQGGSVIAATLGTQFQAGNAPDVIELAPGRVNIPSILEYAKAGYLADLSKRPWAKRIATFAKPLVTLNGKVYGWVMAPTTGPVVVYNKGLFRRLGLTVPKTFAQLLGLCRSIRQKAPDDIPLGILGSISDARAAAAIGIASSEVYGKDPTWNAKRVRNAVTFQSTPGWRTSLQHIVDMKTATCFSPSVAADTIPTIVGQMAREVMPMMWFSDTGLGLLKLANPTLDLGIFVPPATTAAGTYMTVFPNSSIAVNKKAHNMAAAVAWVDFMARQGQDELFSRVAARESAYSYQRALNPKIGAKALDAVHQFAAPYATKGKIKVTGQAFWPTTASFTAFATGVQGLLTGQSTVDDVLKAADAAWAQ